MAYRGPTFVPTDQYVAMQQRRFSEMTDARPLPWDDLRVDNETARFHELTRDVPSPSEHAVRAEQQRFLEMNGDQPPPSASVAHLLAPAPPDASLAPDRAPADQGPGWGMAQPAPPSEAPADDPVAKTLAYLDALRAAPDASVGSATNAGLQTPADERSSDPLALAKLTTSQAPLGPPATPDYLGDLARTAITAAAPPSLEEARRRAQEQGGTPDIPGLPFNPTGPFRPLPYHPVKPTEDEEVQAKVLAGEPLTAQDAVAALTKSAGQQWNATPAAIEGLPFVRLGTSEADLARGFARGLTEGAGTSGGLGGLVRAAGDVGAGGGNLLASAGRATGEAATLGEEAVRAARGEGAGIGRDPRSPTLPGLEPDDFATPPRPAGELPPIATTAGGMPGRARQAGMGVVGEVPTTGRSVNLLGEETAAGAPRTTNIDRLRLLGQASRLSATSTQILNLGGNLAHSLADTFVTKPLEVAADVVRAKLTGRQREQFLEEVLPQARGSVVGAISGLKRVPAILRTGADPADLARYDSRGFDSAALLPAGAKKAAPVVDLLAELPLRELAAADAVATDAAFASHANALATRQAMREGLRGADAARRAEEIVGDLSQYPSVMREADALAKRAVYQGEHPELDWLRTLKAGKLGLALDQVVPFVSTPYDVVAQGLGLNPAQVVKAVQDVRAGRNVAANRRVAQAVTGTVFMGAGYGLAESGYLTGAVPKDQAERSTQPEGWKPFSLRVPAGDGAVYVPIALFGHFAVPLGIGAIVSDAMRHGADAGDLGQALGRVPGGIVKFLGEQTFLDGARTVGRILEDPDRWSESLQEGLASPLMPYSALQRQIDQALGNAQRDPRGAIEALLASTPVLNDAAGVPTRRTALGDERRGVSGPLAFVAGTRITAEGDEPTLRVMREARVAIPKQADTWRGLPLTESEQRAINTRAGELMRETIAPLADDEEFATLPLARRGTILERYRDRAFDAARKEVLGQLGDEDLARRQEMRRRAEETRRPVYTLPDGRYQLPTSAGSTGR